MQRLQFIVALLIFASPALAQQPESNAPSAKPPEQQAPSVEKTPQSTPPGETKPQFAFLRVYRQRRYAGSSLAPSIYVDDKQVARVGNGRRFSARLTPGVHSIRSDDKSSAISVDAKGGQEYYVRVDEETGFWKGHGKLTMLMPEQGRAEYQLQKPVEPDRRLAKEMLEDDSESAPSAKDDKKKNP